MLLAKNGDRALVHYIAKLKDGTVVDSSLNREPLKIRLGAGKMSPGFELAVIGMSPGESKTETIPCSEAYGPHQPEMILTVDRRKVFADAHVTVGQILESKNSTGEIMELKVTEVNTSRVTLDANHYLAGKDLIYEIELLELFPRQGK
ncbi:MAG: peptidylprolyl isomerase [Verrucomicrobiota bacterium]